MKLSVITPKTIVNLIQKQQKKLIEMGIEPTFENVQKLSLTEVINKFREEQND